MAFSNALMTTGYDRIEYRQKVINLFGYSSIVAYWPQNEASGTTSLDISGHAYNGAYTGVTLGAAGIGDGNTAASFDGTTSFNNVYSAGLNTDFSGSEGSILAFGKVTSSGVWTDATARALAGFRVDTNNRIDLRKSATNNTMQATYIAGSTTKTVTATTAGGLLTFFHAAITWSKAGDFVRLYLLGASVGTPASGLGTWSGGALNSLQNIIGALDTTPTSPWSGSIGPVLLLNRAATAAEILAASTL